MSGNRFSETILISILELMTSLKSETAIPRNIDRSRVCKTIRGSQYSIRETGEIQDCGSIMANLKTDIASHLTNTMSSC